MCEPGVGGPLRIGPSELIQVYTGFGPVTSAIIRVVFRAGRESGVRLEFEEEDGSQSGSWV